jgi:hypothetical protein
MYNGEELLLQLRFEELKNVVDVFVVCMADHTHSLKERPAFNTPSFIHKLSESERKRIVFVNFNNYDVTDYIDNPEDFRKDQRNYSVHCLLEANKVHDKDLILVSDIDEIPSKTIVDFLGISCERGEIGVKYFRMDNFSYFLNARVERPYSQFYGTVAMSGRYLLSIEPDEISKIRKNRHLPTLTYKDMIENAGWHFSSVGGGEAIWQKYSARPNWMTTELPRKESFISKIEDFKRNKAGYLFNSINLSNEFIDLNVCSLYDNLPSFITKNQQIFEDYTL